MAMQYSNKLAKRMDLNIFYQTVKKANFYVIEL